jgi:uncharacterized protein (DUF2236 family)
VSVEREELERHLAELAARVSDPRAGLYGPSSISWEVNREGVLMLGGGAAALLQLAHPYVARAIEQHSKTKTDPVGRFQRTFAHVFAMVFGDLEHALRAARRVHTVHTKIEGEIGEPVGRFAPGHRYMANDEAALFWVHATLLQSALDVFERVVRPLSQAERERYYDESRTFAHLFGVPDAMQPRTYRAFSRYWDETIASDTIAVGGNAAEMRRFLFQPPTPAHKPFVAWYEVFTAGLLPPKLREAFGFRFGPRERVIFERSISALRTMLRVTPRRLRYFPAYIEAERRVAGRASRDRVGRMLERVALRGIRPTQARPAA